MPNEQQTSTTPEEEKDLWRSPPWLFRFLTDRFGKFDLDVCASPENALRKKFYTIEDNALDQKWHKRGRLAFMNPPFSGPGKFVQKAYEEAQLGLSIVIILPTHRNQIWGALAAQATEKIEFCGRVNFYKPDGTESKNNTGGTQVMYFRKNDFGFTRTVWVNTAEIKARYEVT